MSAKRWKRGDVGPDGRVFWAYAKDRKNGEYWMIPKKFEASLDRYRKHYEANREKIAERQRQYREENREKVLEIQRKSYKANREKRLQYYESNREKVLERVLEYKSRIRRQQSADQFFIMQAAANEIQEALKSIQP